MSVSLPFADCTVYFSLVPIALIVQLPPALQLTPADVFVTMAVPLVSVVTVDTSVPAQTVTLLSVSPTLPGSTMWPVISVKTIALLVGL